ncbi:IFN-inducible and antiviral protein [Pseudovirgaria hyperparasitica]|uniref:IFN-inducible and antiviral protein n=1 Tax=Pseudovirgaria hyperparasitica TaxID=470096 RepID=A0A6A6WDC2_9PEZI|nr:IFN-inducible and antiviral protein [Pseudovirgaria hyperparasitica]KAF2759856.1 IFN-inducible and antiviral protein [Pseudovirgaria hyperparasitica]
MISIYLAGAIFFAVLLSIFLFPGHGHSSALCVPVSVNYHFTRKCNMTCGFCFHTATTSDMQSTEKAMQGIKALKDAGMRKINFAGGEPFLYPKFLGTIIDYCKDIKVESVSIVSNGSKVTRRFLEKHGKHIDILAISCDSFDEPTNIKIGRGTGNNVEQLYRVKEWCKEFGIKFKLNTVVCNLNWQEDMNKHISALAPFRWKCFQVLIVNGENDSPERLRDATNFLITNEQYQQFITRHAGQKSIVPESNRVMAKSYLILDEYMRFLDRDGRQPSKSILEVGVQKALKSVFWDVESFKERGGIYDWQATGSSCGSVEQSDQKELDW